MSQSSKTSEVEECDFRWGKKKGIGGKKKEVQFYESFTYDDIKYSLYDNVYLYKEDEPEPYVGKLVKIWEQPQEKKKVKILWFFRPIEILNFVEDGETLENELLLATGEGQGLANINPLEAIAGKCRVVCTSKDSRNPQPSPEELSMADYIFYRTFDVGTCTISEKIDDKIVGVEARFLLNRERGQQSSDVPAEKEENGDVTGINGVSQLCPELSTPGTLVNEVVDDKTGHSMKKNDVHLNVSVNQDPLPVECLASDLEAQSMKTEVPSILQEPVPSRKKKLSRLLPDSCKDEVDTDTSISKNDDKNLKSSKDLGLDDRPAKKARIDTSVKVPVKPITSPSLVSNDDKNGSILRKKERDCEKNVPQVLGTVVSAYDDEKKSKPLKDLPKLDKGSVKKVKPDEKASKVSNATLPKTKAVNAGEENVISEGQLMDVTRRPADRSKWFRELPWEERIQDAHEKGILVLLENLDPTYSSTEIEDIIWSGFRESCTAKVVPQTAISSPHSGQASVIFKSRDAADTAVRKLNEGCLMLPNGRPLVASYGTPPSLPGNPSTYLGHLDIDKKKSQLLRSELREAVSTSHYSQPNTIEYDMAMDWCKLQKISESTWKKLYKQQGDSLEKLKVKLKSKLI